MAGSGGSAVPASAVLTQERSLTWLPDLAVGEAVFLPAAPPRSGRMAFWRFGGEPPDLGVEPEELTVVRRHGASVRRARVVAVLLTVDQALPLLTRCRALGADGSGRASADGVSMSTAFWGAA